MGDKVCEKVAEKCLDKNSEKSTKLFLTALCAHKNPATFFARNANFG